MTVRVHAFGTAHPGQWKETLQRCGTYDVYHLPEYHQLIEEQEGARAVLLVCESLSGIIAMPILLRQIETLQGIEAAGYRDVTSVYGYPGPVSNPQHPPEGVICQFTRCLLDYFESERVVSAFSRLHPLFDQELLLTGLDGQVLEIGPTVAIDLSLPGDEQYRQYRTNHKRDIKRARRAGVTCVLDENWDHFDPFLEIYYETMRRVDASLYYFFDRTYFSRLPALLGDSLHLIVALKGGTVVSGALFTLCNSIVQYHLGATDSRYRSLAPSKLVFDTARLWGMQVGASIFHLGGGVGSRKDSLFDFKAGFSKRRCAFKIWRMVVNRSVYNRLVLEKLEWMKANGLEPSDSSYFPTYRSRAEKSVTPDSGRA